MALSRAMEYSTQHWMLKALHEAAEELQSQLLGLSEEDLCRRPAPGEWSLKEIAAHIRDAEACFLERLRLIADQDEPDLPDIDVDAYVPERDYQTLDLYEVLQEFAQLRQRSSSLLWTLEPSEWEREWLHPYRGRLSIMQVARDMNEHDLGHLWQVRRHRRQIEEEHRAKTRPPGTAQNEEP
jgi:hypothetical protein